ncbi:MAG: tRNA (guanosine(37)-N1)-methyltransferase TrmD [Oscillospiraceae bacterium]|nr:tRNA (guanosine(37)-N1)-methyltransferase TrmD [Oscillospiraceae bacterium]
MRIDILTLFPQHMDEMLHESILGRAAKKGILEINCVQIRDYTENRQNQVDDYPYGGGWGCVMMAQPLKSCLDSVVAASGDRKRRVIYLSPQGKTFTQQRARELAAEYEQLILVCGHYEGVDERFIEACVDEELSLGDFVLTGGELAAMAVTDAVCRLVPGVLSDAACYTGESHWDGLLEYPQYTRPETWEGRTVPEVLRGGNQAEIDRWRRKQMLLRTREKRPELFERFTPDAADQKLLSELERDARRKVLTEPIECRPAAPEDIPALSLILRQARNYLKRHRVDQWQGDYPDETDLAAHIEAGDCYILSYAGRPAAVFCLTMEPQPNYDLITDGKWRFDGPYASLHMTAVEAEFRGSGLADRMIEAGEELARGMGALSMRVDTHRHNEAMKALLNRCGYQFRGHVLVDEPKRDPKRQAFEKEIREKE